MTVLDQQFLLPMPPSTNNLFVTVPGRGRVKSRAYALWREEAGWELKRQRAKLIPGNVDVTIIARKPNGKKRDLDNLAKPILDLLVRCSVISDDSLVEHLSMAWSQNADPGVTVAVSPSAPIPK